MILITGGTGTSGRAIVDQLDGAAEFRMLVRDPVRAAETAPRGAELVRGDLGDVDALVSAMEGCERALFNVNSTPELPRQQANFIEAAKRAGVGHVVRFSVLGATTGSSMRFSDLHGQADAALKASGLAWTLVRPTFFMQNLLGGEARTAKERGEIYASCGDGRSGYVDTADIAAVVAAALTERAERHAGQTYEVTGPQDVSYGDIAKAIGDAVGKPVRYVDVPPAAAKQAMLAAGVPEWNADGILELMAAMRAGELSGVTDTVERVTGRKPKSLAEWCRENAAAFR